MKILLAIDDSRYSRIALCRVVQRHWPFGTEIKILTIIKPKEIIPRHSYASGNDCQPFYEIELKRAREIVDRAALEFKRKPVMVWTDVVVGSAEDEIFKAVQDWEPDLLVVGLRSLKGLISLMLESISDKVAGFMPGSIEIFKDTAEAQ